MERYTVKELISELSGYSQDAEVLLTVHGHGTYNFSMNETGWANETTPNVLTLHSWSDTCDDDDDVAEESVC